MGEIKKPEDRILEVMIILEDMKGHSCRIVKTDQSFKITKILGENVLRRNPNMEVMYRVNQEMDSIHKINHER